MSVLQKVPHGGASLRNERARLKKLFFAAGVQRACLQLSRGQQAVVGHPSRREGLPGSNPDGQVRALIILIFEILIFEILKTCVPVEENLPLDGSACT